jgi:hypothetical protein
MVKRGESKFRSRHAAKPVSKQPKLKGIMPKSGPLAREEAYEIRSAARVLEKEERVIKRGINFAFGHDEFHVVSLICSLIIIAFLLNSKSLIFYTVITAGVLLFAHFLRSHSHRQHDVVKIIGLFFLPLAVTIMAFRDLLVWVLAGVYIISAISTFIIYHHHRKVHPPLKVMWQVTYSRIVAITIALLVAAILPALFPKVLFSVFELIFFYVMPVIFVFFFASKFFYLYFFDRKHIHYDLRRSLRHTVMYTLVFVVVLMCVYSLFAVGLYNSKQASYDNSLDMLMIQAANVEKSAMKSPSGISQLPVMKDVMVFASNLGRSMADEKNRVAEPISFASIVDDSYFAGMSDNSFNTLKFVVLVSEAGNVKENVVRAHDRILATLAANQTLGDGARTMEEYNSFLRGYVDASFVPYSQDPSVQEVYSLVNDPEAGYADYDGQGLYYLFAKEAKLDFVYGSESIMGRQVSVVLRHSVVLKELARLVVNAVMFLDTEAASPSAIEYLYADRGADSVLLSSAIRLEMIKTDLDGRDARLKALRSVNFGG